MRTQTAPHDSLPKKTAMSVAPVSLGDYAYRAIRKHFQKSIKHKAGVLEDHDPEQLHQMRVGMRRLRTALQVFATAVDLPDAASSRRITKLAKCLGKVRDLDVMQMWLQKYLEATDLNPDESQQLQQVLGYLQTQRRSQFEHMQKLLNSKQYHQFESAFESWLAHPSYHILAQLPIVTVIPDLLLPLISELLLHPGWLVAITGETQHLHPVHNMSLKDLGPYLDEQGSDLHDLRKQIKRVRYQTEFFLDFYSRAYQKQTEEFRVLQDILGELQDSVVLSQFLVQALGKHWPEKIPSLDTYFQQERLRLWQQWQTLQQKYLNPDFRRLLHRRFLAPQPELGKAASD